MVLYEPQTGDLTIGPFRLAASGAHRGHLQAPHHRTAGSTRPEPGTRRVPGSLRRFLSGSKNTTSAAVNGYPAALPWPRLG